MSDGTTQPDARYVTDVPYARRFTRELSPVWLDFAALICGFTPPRRDRPFEWCELGCGHGVTPVFLAAAYPNGRFSGIDLMPEHIGFAERFARDAGVENTRFHTADFEVAAEEDGPGFDYIVAHGVYSWVDQKAQQDLIRFINRRLNPGGLVYLSYDCLPGWAGDMPLQHLLSQFAQYAAGDSVTRLDAADGALQSMMEAGASILRLGAMGREWEQLRRQLPAHYFVHQLLPPAWQPVYVTDVRAALRTIGLTPLGSATIRENVDAYTLDPATRALVASAPDPDLRELMRDYFLQKRFRRDLFGRSPIGLGDVEARRRLVESRYQLPPGAANTETVAFNDAIARVILDLLADGPASPVALVDRGLPIGSVVAQLIGLAAAGRIWPATPTDDDRIERLNATIRCRLGTSDEVAFLAMPGGMATDLNEDQRAALRTIE
jgi:SAM-dependent methyltransferase